MNVSDIDWKRIQDIAGKLLSDRSRYYLDFEMTIEEFIDSSDYIFTGDVKDAIEKYIYTEINPLGLHLNELLSNPDLKDVLYSDKEIQHLKHIMRFSLDIFLYFHIEEQRANWMLINNPLQNIELLEQTSIDFFRDEGILSAENYLISQFDTNQIKFNKADVSNWPEKHTTVNIKLLSQSVKDFIDDVYQKVQEQPGVIYHPTS